LQQALDALGNFFIIIIVANDVKRIVTFMQELYLDSSRHEVHCMAMKTFEFTTAKLLGSNQDSVSIEL